MNWKDPKIELPKIADGFQSVRCMGLCKSVKDRGFGPSEWRGDVDIFYNPNIGWMRCEDQQSTVHVIEWIYWDEMEAKNEPSKD